ncbi:MAG: alpha/beta hydrolase [Proteobacteria bacterium]|nr:alpha/beta hydrolase [Pseudomonadota bacterium]
MSTEPDVSAGFSPAPAAPAADACVMLVHGLYMNPLWMRPLARRLRAAGWRTADFGYRSLREPPAEAGLRLAQAIRGCGAATVHCVGHSLGGLVIRHACATHGASLPPGRCVTLATPHAGSRVARALQARGATWMLGRSREAGVCGDVPDWPPARELGVILGTHNIGLGRWIAELPLPADGVVAADENACAAACAVLALPYSHTELIFRAEAARQVVAFLRDGRFAPVAG